MTEIEYGVEYGYLDTDSVEQRVTVALDERTARSAVADRTVAGAVLARRAIWFDSPSPWEAAPDE